MEDFLVAIIVFWVLFRLFRPFVFVHWNKPQQTQNYSTSNRNPSPDGEITVNQPSHRSRNISDEAGDYVDYEEIK